MRFKKTSPILLFLALIVLASCRKKYYATETPWYANIEGTWVLQEYRNIGYNYYYFGGGNYVREDFSYIIANGVFYFDFIGSGTVPGPKKHWVGKFPCETTVDVKLIKDSIFCINEKYVAIDSQGRVFRTIKSEWQFALNRNDRAYREFTTYTRGSAYHWRFSQDGTKLNYLDNYYSGHSSNGGNRYNVDISYRKLK